jgi:urease accessory protein
VSLRIESGGYLEYLPDPTIPYAGSAFEQDVELMVEPGGALVYADLLLAGRLAHGERFQFRRYAGRLTLLAPSGRPLLRESFSLEPARHTLDEVGILGDRRVGALLTVIVVAGEGQEPALVPAMRMALCEVECVSSGAGSLNGNHGVVAKALTANAAQARRALCALWQTARRHLLGVDLPPVWKR